MYTQNPPNTISRRRSLPTGKLDPTDLKSNLPNTDHDSKKARERWGNALKKVKRIRTSKRLEDRIGSYVSAKADQKGNEILLEFVVISHCIL
jgi:hypothetical protein